MFPSSTHKTYCSTASPLRQLSVRQPLKIISSPVSSPSKCPHICNQGYYRPALPSRNVSKFAASSSGRSPESEQELHRSKQVALLAVVPVALISLKWVVSTGLPGMVVPALLLAVPIAGSGIRDLLVEGLQMALKGTAWIRSHQPHPASNNHQQSGSFSQRQDHVNSWSRQSSMTSSYDVAQSNAAYHYDTVQMSPNINRRVGMAGPDRSQGRQPGAFSSPAELIAYHKARAAVEQQQQLRVHRPGSPVPQSWSQQPGSGVQPPVSTSILQRPVANQQVQHQNSVTSQPLIQQQQQQSRPASPDSHQQQQAQQIHMRSSQQSPTQQNVNRQQLYSQKPQLQQQQQYQQAQNNVAPTRGRLTQVGQVSSSSNSSSLSNLSGDDMDWPATDDAAHISRGHGPRHTQGRMQDNHPERYAAP